MWSSSMAVQKVANSSSIGHALTTMLAGESQVKRLWADTYRDCIEFWVLTEPIPLDTERRLYGIPATLYEQFPESSIQFHLINPRYFDDLDVTDIVPASAQELRLR